MTLRILLVAVGVTVLVLKVGSTDPVHASHPGPAPNGLWASLEAGGSGQRLYALCVGNLPSTVANGIEDQWDAALPVWNFDGFGICSGLSTTSIDREGTRGSCEAPPVNDPNAVACWYTVSFTSHGGHNDLQKTNIFFDVNHPQGHTFASFGPNWQTEVSAHEWGHNLGLADHGGTQCNEGTLMGQIDINMKATDNPCFMGPTGGDRHSVTCIVYKRWCTSTVMAGNWGNSGGNDDFAVWRPSDGVWYKRGVGQVQFGVSTDIPVPGLFSTDAVMDPAVYRHCEAPCSSALSYWYTEGVCITGFPGTQCGNYNSNGTTDGRVQWGLKGDVPVPGNYDGFVGTDFVWRPGDGFWHIRYLNGQTKSVQFGLSTDVPVPGDYNGDGKTDIAVWRPENGLWLLENVLVIGATYGDFNGNGTTDSAIPFGLRGDIPAQGDYYGSTSTEPAVWRSCSPPCAPPNLGYLLVERAAIPGASYGDFNGNGTTDSQIQWGLAGDLPATGDYAFGLADPTV